MTLLDPFVPATELGEAEEGAIRDVCRELSPITYALDEIGRFPDVLYLAPHPEDPFVELIEALWRRFPDFPPYGGRFERIVPHVTLALGPEPAGLADYVQAHLPVCAVAEEVVLMKEGLDGRWAAGRRFRLGTAR
jgi:hypothetical protein